MRNFILSIALALGLFANAQQYDQPYLDIDIQHVDQYFPEGGFNLGISTLTQLGNISEDLVADLGVGVFHNVATPGSAYFNAKIGAGYRVYQEGTEAVILKANWRGMIIKDDVKGYFLPTAEIVFSDQFSINFSYASEIHPYGFNVPTGRIGIKYLLK